jgi:hypothetical protein
MGACAGVLSLPGLARAIQGVSSPYRRPKLKITDVRTAQVLAHGHQVHIRIYTDQGLIGQGEAKEQRVGSENFFKFVHYRDRAAFPHQDRSGAKGRL